MGVPVGYIIPIALAAGAFVGLLNGAITLYFRVHSLIVTLGVGTFLHDITLWMSDSHTISRVARVLISMSSSSAYSEFQSASIYAVLLAALVWYVLSYTAFGQQLLFTGRGRDVGRLTGVAVGRVRMTAFVASGMMGALAGILYTGTTGSTNPTSGTTLLLPAFAAAFLGATCTKPGRFNAWGSVVAVYFLVPGIKGLSVLGFRTFVHELFYGGALVIAVMVSQLVSGRKERTL
jgi:ribose transport system permease protein